MTTPTIASAAALVALGLLVAGCGSGSNADQPSPSSSSSSPSSSSTAPKASAAPTPTTAAPGKNPTLADFIKQNRLTAVPVKRGDPGSPTLVLPTPAGWQDAGPRTPQGAWSAIYFADPAAASDPATITVNMTKLTGTFDPAKIFDYVPGELKNTPGFQGAGELADKKLAGFDAYQVGGLVEENGVQRLLAQKTVVVPSKDGVGVFVVQISAAGVQDQTGPLMDATSEIDKKTTITP